MPGTRIWKGSGGRGSALGVIVIVVALRGGWGGAVSGYVMVCWAGRRTRGGVQFTYPEVVFSAVAFATCRDVRDRAATVAVERVQKEISRADERADGFIFIFIFFFFF